MKSFSILTIIALLVLVMSCGDDIGNTYPKTPVLPEDPYDYMSTQAGSVAIGDNSPGFNQLTNEGAALGRVLFYDPALSLNNTISCATCHKQEFSFADGKRFSKGFEGALASRNSPSILNMKSSFGFFWDFSVEQLEKMVLVPVQNHVEMGMDDLDYLSEKLRGYSYYPPLFEAAFGSPEVTTDRISFAMSQFIRSITSLDSKFDEATLDGFETLSGEEFIGMRIFEESGCNNCHRVLGSFFNFNDLAVSGGYGGTGDDSANIGLDMEYKDNGIGNGVFKVPSLRNLTFTAPYMHDGRFETIEDVIDHYDTGVQPHFNLDQRLKEFDNGFQPRKLNLTDIEKHALKKFLLTLTDTDLMADERFSDPFQ